MENKENKIVDFVENVGDVVEDINEAIDEMNELTNEVEEVTTKAGGLLARILDGVQRIINFFKNLFKKKG